MTAPFRWTPSSPKRNDCCTVVSPFRTVPGKVILLKSSELSFCVHFVTQIELGSTNWINDYHSHKARCIVSGQQR